MDSAELESQEEIALGAPQRCKKNLLFPRMYQGLPLGAGLNNPWRADVIDTIHILLDIRYNNPEQLRYLNRLK